MTAMISRAFASVFQPPGDARSAIRHPVPAALSGGSADGRLRRIPAIP